MAAVSSSSSTTTKITTAASRKRGAADIDAELPSARRIAVAPADDETRTDDTVPQSPPLFGHDTSTRQTTLNDALDRANVVHVSGDLLEADECDYLVHQCNCKSTEAKGLAALMFKRFPAADVYAKSHFGSTLKREPGTICVRGRVVNLFGQRYPGPPKEYENAAQRMEWFRSALAELATHIGRAHAVVGFPGGFGCGMAGGEWDLYEAELRAWQCRHPRIAVRIYTRPPSYVK